MFTHCVPEPFGIEIIEHELNPEGAAALKPGQHSVDLLSLQGYEDQVIRNPLIQCLSHQHICSLTLVVNDGVVPPQLLQAAGAGAGDGCHLVTALTSQLKRERTTDTADANDRDSQPGRWNAIAVLNHHESMIDEESAYCNHAKSNCYAVESKE